MIQAFAHSYYDPLPDSLFQFKMAWDPTALFFLLMGYLYFKGLKSFKSKISLQKWQVYCFYFGIVCNIAVLVPPVDTLADRLFSVHMIQHMTIMMIGVPLIIIGAPLFVISRGLGPMSRRYVLFPILRNTFLKSLLSFMSVPFVSVLFLSLNLWFWHIPRFYNWALLNDVFHGIEHALFALSSIFLWRNLIDTYPLRLNVPMKYRVLCLVGSMINTVVLAVFLTFQETTLYAHEGFPMPEWWSDGWTHLDDQRAGGLIMWVAGGVLEFGYMGIIFYVWQLREQKKDKEDLEAIA